MYYGMYDFFHGDFNFNSFVGNLLVAMIVGFIVSLIFNIVRLKATPKQGKLK